MSEITLVNVKMRKGSPKMTEILNGEAAPKVEKAPKSAKAKAPKTKAPKAIKAKAAKPKAAKPKAAKPKAAKLNAPKGGTKRRRKATDLIHILTEGRANPRREGTDAHAHFEAMKKSKTVGAYLAQFAKGDERARGLAVALEHRPRWLDRARGHNDQMKACRSTGRAAAQEGQPAARTHRKLRTAARASSATWAT